MDTSGLWAEPDDMIKSSGYRVGPFEVESALMSHPAVLEVPSAPEFQIPSGDRW